MYELSPPYHQCTNVNPLKLHDLRWVSAKRTKQHIRTSVYGTYSNLSLIVFASVRKDTSSEPVGVGRNVRRMGALYPQPIVEDNEGLGRCKCGFDLFSSDQGKLLVNAFRLGCDGTA